MNALMHANFGITDFWTFLLGTIFIVLLPGPNSLYVRRRNVHRLRCEAGDGHAVILAAFIYTPLYF